MSSVGFRPSGGNGCPASQGAGQSSNNQGAATASTQFAKDLQNIASSPSSAAQLLQDAASQFEQMGGGNTVSSFEQALDAQEQALGLSSAQIQALNALVEQVFGSPNSPLPTGSGGSSGSGGTGGAPGITTIGNQ